MKSLFYTLAIMGFGLFAASHYQGRRAGAKPQSGERRGRSRRPGMLLDINDASEDELESLYGIGPVLAAAIVENRPYATKIDLIGRRIIPDNAYRRIKNRIEVRHAA